MSSEQMLEIMAQVDGELAAGRQADVQRLLATDAEAAALHRELSTMRQAIRAHEPLGHVADSREFYWSQIQRRIDQEARAAAHAANPKPQLSSWLRWLVPAIGVAAVAVVMSLQQTASPTIKEMASTVDSSQAEASSLTYRSEADGVTVHWIN